jgi:RNA polymerase sigma-70 factor, ECF subfamily
MHRAKYCGCGAEGSSVSQDTTTSNEFAVLWATAFPRLRVFVLMCVPSYHDAEDVIQETAVAAAADFERYERNRSFMAWVLGIARNRVLRHWRSMGTAQQILFDEKTLMQVEDAFSRTELNPDPRHEALEACLGQLSARSRRLIEHRYVQGLNIEQISARLGGTVQSAYSQLYRIRQALAECVRRRLHSRESSRESSC